MSAIFIAGIAVLVLAVVGLGYVWRVRRPGSVVHGAYQAHSRAVDTKHFINFTDHETERR